MKVLKLIALTGIAFLMSACADKNDKLIDALEESASNITEIQGRVDNGDMSAIDEYSDALEKFTDDYKAIIEVYGELSDSQKKRVENLKTTVKK